jgi:TonB-dependent receptor
VTWGRADIVQDNYQNQIYGADIATGGAGESVGGGLYRPIIGAVQPRYWSETSPEADALGTAQIGGTTRAGAVSLAPDLFFSWGSNDRPDHLETSARNQPLTPAIPFGGPTLFAVEDGFPQPLLSPAQIAASVADIANYGLYRAGKTDTALSSQVKGGAKLDADWTIGAGPLEAIGLGAKYEDSFRQYTYRLWTGGTLFTPTTAPTVGSFGILGGSVPQIFPGHYDWPLPTVNQTALWNELNAWFAGHANALDTCDSILVNNWNCDTQRATEAVSSAYILARLRWGDATVMPGLRFEHTEIGNRFWVIPRNAAGSDLPGDWQTNTTRYDEPLPSIAVNWRPQPRAVYRASVAQSYTRPAFFQLGGGAQTMTDPDGTTSITEGNPHLKPIIATNYDLSGEWVDSDGAAIRSESPPGGSRGMPAAAAQSGPSG